MELLETTSHCRACGAPDADAASCPAHDERVQAAGHRVTLSVWKGLSVLVGAVVVAHLALTVSIEGFDFTGKGQLSLFNLTHERSFGTWVNAALLAAAALATAAAALVPPPTGGRRLRNGWLALAGLIALMSVDEVAMMHEATIELVQSSLELPAFLRFGWMIPALLVIALYVVWQWRFFASLPAWLRTRLIMAGAVYLGAAVGLEMVESQIANTAGEEDARIVLQLLVGLEEGLEMGAAAAVLLFVLRYIAQLAPEWSAVVDIDPGATSPPGMRSVTISAGPVTQAPRKAASRA
jgi:hypothetical protein